MIDRESGGTEAACPRCGQWLALPNRSGKGERRTRRPGTTRHVNEAMAAKRSGTGKLPDKVAPAGRVPRREAPPRPNRAAVSDVELAPFQMPGVKTPESGTPATSEAPVPDAKPVLVSDVQLPAFRLPGERTVPREEDLPVSKAATPAAEPATVQTAVSIPPRVRRMLGEWKDGRLSVEELLAAADDPDVRALVQAEIDEFVEDVDRRTIALGTPPTRLRDAAELAVAETAVAAAGPATTDTNEEVVTSAASTPTTTDDDDDVFDTPEQNEPVGATDSEPASASSTGPIVSPTGRRTWVAAQLPDVEVRADDGVWDESVDSVDVSNVAALDADAAFADAQDALPADDGDIVDATPTTSPSASDIRTFAEVQQEESEAASAAAFAAAGDNVAESLPADVLDADVAEASDITGADLAAAADPTQPFESLTFSAGLEPEQENESSIWQTAGAGFDIELPADLDWNPLAGGGTPSSLAIRATSSIDVFEGMDDARFARDLVAQMAVEGTFDPFLGDFVGGPGFEGAAPDMFSGATAAASGDDVFGSGADVPVPSAIDIAPRRTERSDRAGSAGWSQPGPTETRQLTAPAAMMRRSSRRAKLRLATQPESLAGISLGVQADLEPPPELRFDVPMVTAPEVEPLPGSTIEIGGAPYTVMAADDAIQRLLRTGDLPEGTYVHQLDLGYYPDSWERPSVWYLRPYLHSRMVTREEDFHIPRQGPTSSDCLPVDWPQRPIRIHRCCFGTLNLSRAHFPAGFTMTESRVLTRVAAVRVRFDGWVDFARSVMPAICAFFQARATGSVTFRRCVFLGVAWFAELRFDGFTSFREADFHGDLDLGGSRFGEDLDLRGAVIGGHVDLSRISTDGGLDLTDAGLHGDLNLQLARIGGASRLDNLICAGEAQFNRSRFSGDASFAHVRISGPALFEHAHFGADARIRRCRFGSTADFYALEVDGAFDLTDTVFHADVVLATSRFHGMVRLNVDAVSRNRSESAPHPAEFRGNLRADHAVFRRPVLASGVQFHGKTSFRRATFEESSTFADAAFRTGFDLAGSFHSKELDLRGTTIGGRLNLDGAHIGGRALLPGAHFRAISLSDATVGVLMLDREQLYPDRQDLAENRLDPEVPPFRPRERALPVKLYNFRHAVVGPDPAKPGARAQNLTPARRREVRKARLAGGMDAELRLEEGGARLVAFERARQEFLLIEKSLRELGRREQADWSWVQANRMGRAVRVLAGRGVRPVDETLLGVEREIARLDEMRRLIESDDTGHERFPKELRKRRESMIASEASASMSDASSDANTSGELAESWGRLKDTVLKAIASRIGPLQERRRRTLDRLRPLERERSRNPWRALTGSIGWRARTFADAVQDATSAYGTSPWRVAGIALLVVVLFAAFYTRQSYVEEATLPHQPAMRAAERAIVYDAEPGRLTTVDAVGEESVPVRFSRYTLFSLRAISGQALSGDGRPHGHHPVVIAVLLEMLLGLLLLVMFITASVRRVLR
ncbi:MAG: pentapeptide repeat-containing protein [Planctomycetota bacterium]